MELSFVAYRMAELFMNIYRVPLSGDESVEHVIALVVILRMEHPLLRLELGQWRHGWTPSYHDCGPPPRNERSTADNAWNTKAFAVDTQNHLACQ